MGLFDRFRKNYTKSLRMNSKLVNVFYPGLGMIGTKLADEIDKLGTKEKKKFNSYKTKAAKLKYLKSLKK